MESDPHLPPKGLKIGVFVNCGLILSHFPSYNIIILTPKSENIILTALIITFKSIKVAYMFYCLILVPRLSILIIVFISNKVKVRLKFSLMKLGLG